MRVQLAQKFGGIYESAGLVNAEQPLLHGRAVMWIAGKTILDDFHLFVCSVLKRIAVGSGVNEAFDRIIIVKVYIDLTQKAQLRSRLHKSENSDRISVDVTQPTHVGFGLDLKMGTCNMDIVPFPRS